MIILPAMAVLVEPEQSPHILSRNWVAVCPKRLQLDLAVMAVLLAVLLVVLEEQPRLEIYYPLLEEPEVLAEVEDVADQDVEALAEFQMEPKHGQTERTLTHMAEAEEVLPATVLKITEQVVEVLGLTEEDLEARVEMHNRTLRVDLQV